ncbi:MULTISPECIES: copper resistance CopC/CopD family protein [unclassified Streptomyces]|uniref:copper resistance CopC/CopD family protein n=1 Tax=unclassified Streptomyces TaxID=2593676 RepID=UPI000F5B98D7|nr:MULTISPECIES: copper resistance protein CopC [unclassified Streptomyces]WSG52131.1 copper resistance protein CopC [Streptomyces sp. NBC_01732]MCX4395344.1 copper resistance protein CopC [Streptomyces sp. NBC_01767]MCX5102026.1 copper resistance protein CopC [Streptomyces sp. NBC_00439]RPK68131.1 Copper transport protein YcnJ precursor [Streptomyces sp. ADI95-17]WSP47834.1 copper resistance protein CopC [Streptomyces sp. NBC_01243]
MTAATAPHFGPTPSTPAIRRPLAAAAVLAALVGMVFGLLLGGAGPASAHAALTGSDPQDGAVVATAPKEVTLTFSEQVALGDDSIRILDPDGKRADTGAAPRDLQSGSTVKYGVSLHAGLPDGTYTVAWQAVSADSHPVSGAFTFSVGAPSKTTVALPTDQAGGGLVGTLYDIARYAAYAGFILLAGGSAFVLACWQRGAGARPLQRLVVRGWMTLTVATLAMLLLRNPYTGSGKLADAFDLDGLKAVLDTKPGAALVSRLLLLGASALFIAVLFGAYAKREDEREKKDLTFGLAIGGTVIAAGIAGTWALAEHASTGIQPGIAMPVDVLHLLAVAAWLGGLTALLVALYRTPDMDATAVRRFSGIAFGSVVVLAATGIYQSWRQVGTWSALTGTGYGQLLLVKVGLVAVLIGIAWFSRRWTARLITGGGDASTETRDGETAPAGTAAAGTSTTETSGSAEVPDTSGATAEDPARAAQLARQQAAVATAEKKRIRDADPDRSGLRRSVLAEVGVAVALLAVTTVLTSTEPARTEEEAARASTAASAPETAGPVEMKLPFDTGGENGKGTVRMEITPARTGANELHLWVDGSDGKPMDVPEVKVAFTLESKDIGPLPVVPARLTEGHWTADGVQIPMAGNWKVAVTVRTSDIDQTTIDKNMKIG